MLLKRALAKPDVGRPTSRSSERARGSAELSAVVGPRLTFNFAPRPRWRHPVAGGLCFGKPESSRLCSISLITGASRINAFAGHGRRDVARCPRPRGGSAGDSDSVSRRHGDGQPVASTIATAGAAELPLKVEQFGVPRSAVLQQRGGDVSPPSARRTGRDDHMPLNVAKRL
jgi:hypothetical protein